MNLQSMKEDIITQISNMDEETFFKFITALHELDVTINFSNIFTCPKCEEFFGRCECEESQKTCLQCFNEMCHN